MKLNTDKTNVMLFTRSRSWDFQPELLIDGNLLNVVESSKLLGVFVSSNMKWDKNIEYIRSKGMKRLWMLRRVKDLGGSLHDLLNVFDLQIRSVTEIACPVWNGSITKQHERILEGIQKSATKLMLGQGYKSYPGALNTLNLTTLEDRREQISLAFAKKASKSSKFNPWFKEIDRLTRTNEKFFLPKVRTASYEKSPLVYLTKLLNSYS